MKQFKTFECKFEFKESEEDDLYFNVKAYGSTFSNVDLVNDAVDKGAFKKSLKKRKYRSQIILIASYDLLKLQMKKLNFN